MVDDHTTLSLTDLLREANDLRRPARSLRAIATLRQRLEELEEFHVEHVIELGWSWGQVAAALGISRQAAHKRYAGRLKRGFGTERVTVTADARRAVQRARAEAARHGHRSVGPAHLVLALLHRDAGTASSSCGRRAPAARPWPRRSRRRPSGPHAASRRSLPTSGGCSSGRSGRPSTAARTSWTPSTCSSPWPAPGAARRPGRSRPPGRTARPSPIACPRGKGTSEPPLNVSS